MILITVVGFMAEILRNTHITLHFIKASHYDINELSHERLSICVCAFPFGFEGGLWDLIVLVPGHYQLYLGYLGVVGWCDGAG